MRHRILLLISALMLALSLPASIAAQAAGPAEETSVLYVLGGTSGSIEGNTLTLHGVSSVVWFTDRPVREAGHVSVADFVEGWAENGSFTLDPPNADLDLLEGGEQTNLVVELLSVEQNADTLIFQISVLEGSLDNGPFGVAALFIDDCDPAIHPGCPTL